MKKIKYGLIGFGGIAENRIAKEGFACDGKRFSPLESVVLVGTCDLNAGRRPAAEALGLKWYNTVDALLSDPEIDAVFIATNNQSHVTMATRALNAGKHVIVEKPLASTVEDAVQLAKLAAEKKLSITVDHMMVYNKLNRKAREIVANGTLGTVNDSCFHMEFAYGFTPEEAATWRCSKWEELGGPIGDVASHCFYMAEFIFDDFITDISAVYYPKTMDIVVEDGAYIKFRTKKGQVGSVKVAFSEQRGGLGGTLSNLGFEIYGSKAVLRSFGTMFQLSGYKDEPIPIRLELDRFTNQEKFTLNDDGTIPNLYQGVIMHHAQSIQEHLPLVPDEAIRNVKQCFAAHESAQHAGKTIKI